FQGPAGISFSVIDDEGGKVEAGSLTSYTVSVQNQSSEQVSNVRVTATLPPELELESPPARAKVEGKKLIFDPVNLPAGGDARYQVRVKAVRAGDARFEVELRADQLG